MKRIVLILAIFSSAFIYAKNSPPPPTTPPPPGLPIDNGVIFLIIFSVLFAFYKLFLSQKIINKSS